MMSKRPTEFESRSMPFRGISRAACPRSRRRLVREVLYGVQARGSVRLSEIGRALGERTTLKKVIERLDRQLGRPGLREGGSGSVARSLWWWAVSGELQQEGLIGLLPSG